MKLSSSFSFQLCPWMSFGWPQLLHDRTKPQCDHFRSLQFHSSEILHRLRAEVTQKTKRYACWFSTEQLNKQGMCFFFFFLYVALHRDWLGPSYYYYYFFFYMSYFQSGIVLYTQSVTTRPWHVCALSKVWVDKWFKRILGLQRQDIL